MGAGLSHQDVSVVIVGGGLSGTSLAVEISKLCNVTVIDRSPLFFQNLAAPRSCAMSGWADYTLLEREGNWPAVKQVRGKVTGFNREEKTVTVRGHEEAIKYDYLVLATGSQVPFPGKVPLALLEKGREEVVQAYNNCTEKVAAADRVVIVGGGAVGYEIAGEIIVQYPTKEVTIVHARDHLFDDGIPMAFRENAAKKLTSRGVQMKFGQKVDLSEIPSGTDTVSIAGPVTLKTDKEEEIEADVVLVCIGVSVNKCAYEGSLKAEQIENGYVKVDEHLRVEGEEHIFAIGDCNNVPMAKLFVNGKEEAKHVAGVLKSIWTNKPLKRYHVHNKATLVLPVGRVDGIGLYNGSNLPGLMVKKLKCHDMTMGRVCSDLKVTLGPYPKGLPPVPKPVKAGGAAAAAAAAPEGEQQEEATKDEAEPAAAGESAEAAADTEAPKETSAEEAKPEETPAAASEEAGEAKSTDAASSEEPAAPSEEAKETPAAAAEETPAAEDTPADDAAPPAEGATN